MKRKRKTRRYAVAMYLNTDEKIFYRLCLNNQGCYYIKWRAARSGRAGSKDYALESLKKWMEAYEDLMICDKQSIRIKLQKEDRRALQALLLEEAL